MPYPEKTEPVAELPNPELNPLLNPTLGKNLGRWAEVYFTTPPEKREEAVGELLRELKSEPVSPQVPENPAISLPKAETHESVPAEIVPDPTLKCSECGHLYATPQRFCGMCGAPMGTAHTGYRAATLPPPQEFVFPQSSIFGATIPPAETTPGSYGSDISWLREKRGNADAESSFGRVPRFAPAVVAIAAIGILIYAQSRPAQTPAKPSAPVAATQPAKSPEAQRATDAPSANAAASTPASETSGPRQAAAPETPASTPPETSLSKQPVAESRPQPPANEQKTQAPAAQSKPTPEQDASDPSGNGSQELALAEDYLNGRRGPRDSAEAAKFLWKAVGKENPSAILLLSDMYLVGDGVPKSCDQARLLLTAAVRKNVPQAAQKLRNLLNSGCP